MKTKFLFNPIIIPGVLLMLAISCKKKDDSVTPDSTSSNVTPITGTVTDIDNNVYHTVIIGKQTWMSENLKVTKYRNGNPIPNVIDNTQWGKLTTGAYCDYYNNTTNVATYGRLYNWHAIHDNRNIAPTGWHVASDAEWKTLSDYINSVNSGLNLGKAMAFTSGWKISTSVGDIGNDQASNNSSGFSALPGGYHSKDGNYYFIQEMALWWSATEADSAKSYYRSLYYGGVDLTRSSAYKEFGYAVRCVKD
jgi:uncharacterized protein (TIGR02145 family)